jgi:hypothetical protein
VNVSVDCLGRGLIALVLMGLCSALTQACGDDPPGANDAPATEPSLTLLSVIGAGAHGWRRGDDEQCVERGHDELQTLIAQVRIDGDWLLRPLRNCESRTRCGYVEIDVTNEQGDLLLTEAAASLSINLPLAGLSVPDGSALTFTARLMDQYGTRYVVADGGLCGETDTCSVTLALADACSGSASEDSGASDAATGSPSDAAIGLPDATTPGSGPDGAALDGALPDGSTGSDSGLPDGGSPSSPSDASPNDADSDASDAADAG